MDEIEFLTRGQQGGNQGGYGQPAYGQGGYVRADVRTYPAAPSQAPPEIDVYDEDIPF